MSCRNFNIENMLTAVSFTLFLCYCVFLKPNNTRFCPSTSTINEHDF